MEGSFNFKRYQHILLTKSEQREKAWLSENNKVYNALVTIVRSKSL